VLVGVLVLEAPLVNVRMRVGHVAVAVLVIVLGVLVLVLGVAVGVLLPAVGMPVAVGMLVTVPLVARVVAHRWSDSPRVT
jgi:hypothetical protein